MKKIISLLLPMLILSIGSTTAQSEIVNIITNQVTANVKLPLKIGLLHPQMIKDYQLDTITIDCEVTKAGKVKNIVFTKASQQALNDIFYQAIRKVKLPKSNSTKQLTLGFKLKFIDMNEISSSVELQSGHTSRNYKIVDLSSGVPRSNSGYKVNFASQLVAYNTLQPSSARKDISTEKFRRLTDINNTMTNGVIDGQKNPTGMYMYIVDVEKK